MNAVRQRKSWWSSGEGNESRYNFGVCHRSCEEPGLYELQSPATVKSAIEASKGLLPYADVNHLHLEDTLEESTHIHVEFNFHGSPEELLRKTKISLLNDGTEADLQKNIGHRP